jgi:sulfatase modifying factor 1
MSDIFISYAHEDRPRAAAIAKALEGQGWSVWWDRDIRAGKNIALVIEHEIAKARCVVVLWSAVSIHRDWVNDEAREANERGILVPVILENVRPPLGLRSMRAADLSAWKRDPNAPEFRRLCTDIQALMGTIRKAAAPAATGHRRFEWRWPLWGAALIALVCAGYLVYRLPGRKTASAPHPGAQINPKDGLPYVWIQPGEFQMGDNEGNTGEKPQHRVRIAKGFWLGAAPVTVAAYKRFVSERPQIKLPDAPAFNPGWSKPYHPIVRVTWDEAQAYCAWADGAAGKLPTEAQWEYAARAGKDGLKFPWGNEITAANANYSGSMWNGTSPVRSYPANDWGLLSMAGNVWEWTADWYDQGYYASLPPDQAAVDPRGPPSGVARVLRGGSYLNDARSLRVAARFMSEPEGRHHNLGFRCIREAVP